MKNNNNDFKFYVITEMYSFIKKEEIETIGAILNEENNNINTNRNTIPTLI